MSKKILVLDLDGVIYPWQEQFLKHLQMFYGYIGDIEDLFCSGQYFNSKNSIWKENMVCIEHLYGQRPPTLKTIEILNKLSDFYELIYVTERPEDVRIATEHYLKAYKFPNHESLVMCDDKVVEIRLLDADFCVEDRGDKAEELSKFSTVILYEQDWNKDYKNKFITVRNLFELEKLLLNGELHWIV